MEKKAVTLTCAFLCLICAAFIAFLVKREESRIPAASRLDFHSRSFFRECMQWDEPGQRFIFSLMQGGLAQVRVGERAAAEELVVKDPDLQGYASLGLKIDHHRQRVVVVVADILQNRYSGLAAYDMKSWKRIYSIKLAGDERASFADDVALDLDGNAYVTDMKGNLVWKVNSDGSQASILTASPVFSSPKNKLPFNLVGLNGIAYHPDGYLLVVHTWSGTIFKVSIDGSSVSKVDVNDYFFMPDGITLLSSSKLVVAAITKALLVESYDGWKTARITHCYTGPRHRLLTAVTVKGEGIFVNFANAFPVGFSKYSATIGEASFEPLSI